MSARVRMRQLYCLGGRLKIQPINEGEIIDVNSFMEKMVGYSCQELKGKKLWEAGFILDIEAVRSAFLELQKKEYCFVKIIKLETKDGQLKTMEFIFNKYTLGQQQLFQCNIRGIPE